MDIIFGYIAGLLTLINPCVLPVLPIALAASFSSHNLGPLALAAGMSLTFTFFGVFITALGPAIGLNIDQISQYSAIAMVLFGIVLLVPKLSEGVASATTGLAAKADQKIASGSTSGIRPQFFGGALLGAVWTPCIGPTLGGAISLASQGESLIYATAIMFAFSLGISTVILALAYGARETIKSRQDWMRKLAEKSKPILGVTFIAIGAMIYFKLHYYLEAKLLEAMPIWLQDLSVSI